MWHATLASAAAVLERIEPSRDRVVFHTLSGPLAVSRDGVGFVLDFPSQPSVPVPIPVGMTAALGGSAPVEVLSNAFNYMAVFESAATVRTMQPDFNAVARFDRSGVIVTAKGDGDFDFISRYFAPAKGILEDPVTGAAHCMLAPYWASKLGSSRSRRFRLLCVAEL